VGHGITAPEFQWDDYKDVDVRGKVVVLFTGEPPSEDPKFFSGPALTYYGRWTYKYEQATRQGAIGAIIIHTTPTASYGWDVVRSSWGREDQQVKAAPGAPALAFAGWVTQDAGEKIAAALGHSADELLRMADARGFHAMPLPLRFHLHTQTKLREIATRNVVARFEGSDPQLKNEAVIFSAHWDHLGIGSAVNGDAIYNGAADNATGCGVLLEMARAWAALPQKPRRSALFLAVTAEEAGLPSGIRRLAAEAPNVRLGKTRAWRSISADTCPTPRATSGQRAEAHHDVSSGRRGRPALRPDARARSAAPAGEYYRSDHFSFCTRRNSGLHHQERRRSTGTAARNRRKAVRGIQQSPLSSTVRRISRRLGLRWIGSVRALRLPHRYERREFAGAAYLARR
jgi:hypothetical protein